MKAILFVTIIALAVFANAASNEEFSSLWNAWKTLHQKTYASVEEDAKRFDIFVQNYYKVIKFNSESEEDGARLGLNKFADLTKQEFKSMIGGAFVQNNEDYVNERIAELDVNGPLPTSFDWRDKGAVTPVKDQGQCGSCWSFSTTGVIEGYNFIKTGSLLSFAEQQIVDCDTANYGCNGGWPYLAVEYAAKNGLELESDYPYKAQDGNCVFSSSKAHKVVGNYKFVTPKSTLALSTAIVGSPVSVLIEADQDVFQLYKSGVITGGCGASIDHAVLAVGFGVFGSTPAFIVKNSWGTSWGTQGYVYLSTNQNVNNGAGVCGVLTQPMIATA